MKKIRIDLLLILILAVISAFVRVIFLDKIPSGLHGDEAWTGLDARRLMQEGTIPLYVESALGQLTGPLYVTSLIFKTLGESILNLRLSMALFGILTIPLFYLLLRIFFNRTVSFSASLTFSFSLIHLHY